MSNTRTVTAPDGTRLLLRTWCPGGDPRAAIVLIHGLGEHSGRYEHVGAHLAKAGFTVRAIDLRGFGASDGRRAYVASFDDYLADIEPHVIDLRDLELPVVMIGHSLGGLVALRFVQEARAAVDLLVLSAPMIDAVIPSRKRTAAAILGALLPRLTLPNDFNGDQFARDPAVGEAYFADPLVVHRTTLGLGAELLATMKAARSGGVDLPTLVVHGSDDALVPAAVSEPLAALPNVERVVFPGFRHESFNEDGGIEALQTVTAWIRRNLDQTAA